MEDPRSLAQRVLASDLDADLPAVRIGEWIRTTLNTTADMQWLRTACPATHEQPEPSTKNPPVCVLITAGVGSRRGPERPLPARKGELVVAVSIRLGSGNPNSGVWQLERPHVEDAFIERDGDSVTVTRLRGLPELLRMTPNQWPKSDLSVSSRDIRCDKALPKPGETVRCEVTVHNRGGVEALARVYPSVAEHGNDIAPGARIPVQRIPPNGQVVVGWEWVWPKGRTWSVMVAVELHTPHAWGGYRIAIREANVENNQAFVTLGAEPALE